MTRLRESFPLLIVIPTKVGIQSYYLMDPLFQGGDKRQISYSLAPSHCHSLERGNPE
ncbi:MAG: hypothetical protein SFT68_03710 [Rickettsiaceae bacterium]|nr:hypothetical protein [Rickettsiaceae bacterium]